MRREMRGDGDHRDLLRLAPPLLNRLFRVFVVTDMIEAYSLNRLFCVMGVMEIIEAYCRLAPPLEPLREADLHQDHIMKMADEA